MNIAEGSNEPLNALAHLRRESLDIYNRLHSIDEDVTFVRAIREAYSDLPILPNLRCGAWYTDPRTATDAPAYFKSTDGHYNNWSFNLRRANLHLLDLIAQKNGMIIVDSTRSGKRIPDALSKTIPIWCAVVNRAIQRRNPSVEHLRDWDVALYTPPGTVSSQENHQMAQRLESWVAALVQSSFDLPVLPLPLRPLWITPATSSLPDNHPPGELPIFIPIICVSASKQVSEGLARRSSGFTYIQGSGDDHESWGMGLHPTLFWAHKEELLAASRAEISTLVQSLVSSASHAKERSPPTPILRVNGRLLICTLSDIMSPSARVTSNPNVDLLLLDPNSSDESEQHPSSSVIPSTIRTIHILEGKRGGPHFSRNVLPGAMYYIGGRLSQGRSVCVACPTGKDISVGVVLAALQKFFSDTGEYHDPSPGVHVASKNTLQTRLQWIISSRPLVNPSRTTLKRVNIYFFSAYYR